MKKFFIFFFVLIISFEFLFSIDSESACVPCPSGYKCDSIGNRYKETKKPVCPSTASYCYTVYYYEILDRNGNELLKWQFDNYR